MASEFLDTVQAAERLRISPRTLEKFRVQGGGPRFFKIGRLVYYTDAMLEEWVQDRVRTSTSDRGTVPLFGMSTTARKAVVGRGGHV